LLPPTGICQYARILVIVLCIAAAYVLLIWLLSPGDAAEVAKRLARSPLSAPLRLVRTRALQAKSVGSDAS
jgi:hypothetical protein